jgi:hypothetical protein
MTAPILGTLAGKKTRDHDDFVQKFIASVTHEEWTVIAAMPPLKRVEQLISFVVEMRRMPKHEVPRGHPLGATQP